MGKKEGVYPFLCGGESLPEFDPELERRRRRESSSRSDTFERLSRRCLGDGDREADRELELRRRR